MVNKRKKAGGTRISMVKSFVFSSHSIRFDEHCLDKWIARQMEIHPDKDAVLLVAGKTCCSISFLLCF